VSRLTVPAVAAVLGVALIALLGYGVLAKGEDKSLDQAVANGRIDETRAATIKEKIPTLAEKLVNRTWGQHAQA